MLVEAAFQVNQKGKYGATLLPLIEANIGIRTKISFNDVNVDIQRLGK